MPSFAELRAKAEAAASTARDKTHTALASSSSSATKYTPSRPSPAPAPAPAPKPTSLASSSRAPVRPPPSRAASSSTSILSPTSDPAPLSRPGPDLARAPPTTRASGSGLTRADKPFTEYDALDKRNMFAALDLFFESRSPASAKATPPVPVIPAVPVVAEPTRAPPPQRKLVPNIATIPNPPSPAPPSAPLSTRPRLSPSMSSPTKPVPTYPPPEQYSSSALALSHYILSAPFTSPCFADPAANPIPPPLRTRSDHQSSFSWRQRDDLKQFVAVSVFGDLSVAWYRISWRACCETDLSMTWLLSSSRGGIRREAKYRPVPNPWDGQRLYESHERYGRAMSRFARSAVDDARPVARGECWDLAHEGLVQVKQHELGQNVEEPFVSIGRTHGHLLFWADATDPDNGRWYGGDLYVREGDIVEWKSVRIREVGMGLGSYSILGDPDHTAVIVGTGSPTVLPEPSTSLTSPSRYSPASLSSLTVVEQSLGQVPTERTYDLSAFSRGEMWIYRPCGIEALVGVDKVEAVWPSDKGIQSWEVGELE